MGLTKQEKQDRLWEKCLELKWKNDCLQFTRLIAESGAEGVFTGKAVKRLSSAMDLTETDIVELIQRATAKFDEIKSKL